jgi:hypothetical protein
VQTDRKMMSIGSNKPDLERENILMSNKLRTVYPSVGSANEWKNHFKKHKAQCRRLT